MLTACELDFTKNLRCCFLLTIRGAVPALHLSSQLHARSLLAKYWEVFSACLLDKVDKAAAESWPRFVMHRQGHLQ